VIRLLLSSILLTLISPESATVDSTADRLERINLTPTYIKGDCGSLEQLFRFHGMTNEEHAFFFSRGILKRESECGRDTYNEATGDTGVCQINPVHSRSGYFFGKYYEHGWTIDLFGFTAGHKGIDRDDPNIIPACLWLLRGGNYTPGKLNTSPWSLQR